MTTPDLTPITEALTEPGQFQLWVTFSSQETRLVDLRPMLELPAYQALRLSNLFARVKITADGARLQWPGGALLEANVILSAPHSSIPIQLVALLPASQRFRPLLPFLQHLVPPPYLHPPPIGAHTVTTLLRLKSAELDASPKIYSAPPAQVFARLYDLAVFLTEYFPSEALHGLLRRPWLYARQQCPADPLLHTMLGCLKYGRPDLVERPCMLLATGGT